MLLSLDGCNYFYTDEGQGEVLLFLHGGMDSVANYDTFLATLRQDFRVIAVDRRGHGKTPDTDVPFDYSPMAMEIKKFTDAVGINTFHIIGYSDGANIGLHLASLYPERVESLIAISANYLGLSKMSEEWLEVIFKLSPQFVKEHMPGIIEQYTKYNPAPDVHKYIEKTKQLWNQPVVISAEKLQALEVRTLIAGGDNDFVLPVQLLEMRSLIPKSSLLILPGCDHFIFQDFAFSPIAKAATIIFKEFILSEAHG